MMDAIEAANIERSNDLPSDVDDILHYIDALNYGLERTESLPFTLRFIRELHEKLMTGARTTHNPFPGEFRTSQNWIGGTRPDNARFVPPPVPHMKRALGDLENFIHAEDDYLPLIKAALLHAQFETIHPFADGNKRVAFAACDAFLRVNNYKLQASPAEMLNYMQGWIAAKEDRYAAIVATLREIII